MRQIKQLIKYIQKLTKYFLIYLGVLLIVGLVFAGIYNLLGVEQPFMVSIKIMGNVDIESKVEEIIAETILINKFIKTVVDLFLVAWLISKLYMPICPICFSKYAIYNPDRKVLVFRYWILKRRNYFLYNAKIRIVLTTLSEYNRGVNNIQAIWQWGKDKPHDSYKEKIQLNQIRGVRYIELDPEDVGEILKEICKSDKRQELRLDVVITANDENGRTFSKWKSYSIDEILLGYGFAPIEKNDLYSYKLFVDQIKDASVKRIAERGKFYNYQNFDKVYRIFTSAYAESVLTGEPDDKDVLQHRQIVCGVHKGIWDILIKIVNSLTYKFFNKPISI